MKYRASVFKVYGACFSDSAPRMDHKHSAAFYEHFKLSKCKGKVHRRIDHEGPEEEYKYDSTLSLTSALDEVGGQRQAQAALYPRERPGTYCTGD